MIQTRKDLNFYTKEDARRNGYDKGSLHFWASLIYGSENAYSFLYLKRLRHCEYHYNNSSNFIHKALYYFYKILLNHLGLKLKIQIPINIVGYGFRILHLSGGGGVFINAKKIGNYCGINSGVLLGTKDDLKAVPTVGDYTAFGPGVKVYGQINIGNNVFVASNSVVTKNIPDNCIVTGIPAKILRVRPLEENVVYQEFGNSL